MSTLADKSIGGYQALELPFYKGRLESARAKTNSARSAIKLVLRSVGASKVWLPSYICNSVVEAVKELGLSFQFYRINRAFNVDSVVRLSRNEYILLVDYFGVCRNSLRRDINRFGPANTIIDCSQAFFTGYTKALATVYSPRKFFGLPDGGLVYSEDTRIRQPRDRDNSSETRMNHLINRLINSPEAAYHEYLKAEKAISELPVQGMSRLTERLLSALDYETARTKRANNARYLHARLRKYNQLDFVLDEDTVPLCYPFLPNVKTLTRSELISNRVFLPVYWKEVLEHVECDSFEWDMVSNGLFLPCDQRYNESDMARLIGLLAIK